MYLMYFLLFQCNKVISANSRHSSIFSIIKGIISVLKHCVLYSNHHGGLEILLAAWLPPAKKPSGILEPVTCMWFWRKELEPTGLSHERG